MGVGRIGLLGAGLGRLGASQDGDHFARLKNIIANLPLDSFYLFAQPTEAEALTDLAKPARSATKFVSPAFTPNKGYTGGGATSGTYIDTNYNPAVDAVNFSQNSNSFGIWSLTNIADPSGGWDFGQTNYAIAPFGTSKRDYFTRNSSTTSNNFQFWPQAGNLYGANRTSSSGYTVFQNGAPAEIGYASVSNSGQIKTGLHGQGWCTDGAYYYIFEQDALRKRSRSDWSLLSSNTNVFAGLSGSPNHFGDGDIHGSYLYVPAELYAGSCSTASSDIQIARYNLSDLSLADTHPISGMYELSGIAIDHTGEIIYAVSYCDNSKVFCFDLNTFTPLRSIILNTSRDFNFGGIQGIAFHAPTKSLWISCICQTSVSPNRFVVNIDLNGNVLNIISVAETTAQLEGLNFDADGKLGVMQDDGGTNQYVYFYNLPSDGAFSYTQASAAIPSETFTVFRRNGVLTYTPNQIAAVFAGGGMTGGQWRSLYEALHTYLRSVGVA